MNQAATATNGPVQIDPSEYIQDSRGRWVPRSLFSDLDLLRDETVRDIAASLEDLHQDMKDRKAAVWGIFRSFLDLAAEEHNVEYRGNKTGIVITSLDGSLKLEIENYESLRFNEGLHLAKELIDEYAREAASDLGDELQGLLLDVFEVDKVGSVNVKRVLDLRRYKIKDPRWKKAMKIIDESLYVAYSKKYMRVHKRDEDGKWQQIVLDWAALPAEEGREGNPPK